MVALEVYTKSVQIKYKAFLLSKASFVSLCCIITSLVFPFVLCYGTGGFWQKWDYIYEQPSVKFLGKYLLLATTTNSEHPIICSSFLYYQKYMKSFDTCFRIKVREIDKSLDGKVDSLHFVIAAKIPQNSKVTSFYLILPLNYSLQNPCNFHIQSAIIYQHSILNHVSKLSIYADLNLYQSEALKCSKFGSAINSGTAIFDDEKEIQSYELEEIISKYMNNKIRTVITNELTTFIPTVDNTFTISFTINYPEHKIYHKPKLLQILKFAWTQYIALYIITSWIIYSIKRYIFDNNLVLLYKVKTNK